MRNPFRPKEYGRSIAIARIALIDARDPEGLMTEVHNRLSGNAIETDLLLSRRRGRFAFWRPRGLNWATFKVTSVEDFERHVTLVMWRAWSR